MRRRRGAGPKSNYITAEGAKRLRDELEQLWHVERPRITREVTEAAAQGDRSENAEYIYGKRRLREIDRRVHFLSHRFEELVVVEPRADGDHDDTVRFGAWVKLEKSDIDDVGDDDDDDGDDDDDSDDDDEERADGDRDADDRGDSDRVGDVVEYRLVGPDEFDPSRGYISLDSPVGRAILGKRVDDEVTVKRPKGSITYTVIAVRYR